MSDRFTIKKEDLPGTLPVFPLKGFLVFPKLNLPLNIFEPRYLAMVDDALATPHRLIGMIQPEQGSDENDDAPALEKVGCASRIVSFAEAPEERYVVAVGGIARFKVGREIEPANGYRRIVPEWDEYFGDLGPVDDQLVKDEVKRLLSLSSSYFKGKELHFPRSELMEQDSSDVVNLLSVLSPFSDGEKQALLEAPDIGKRAVLVRAFMEDALSRARTGNTTVH